MSMQHVLVLTLSINRSKKHGTKNVRIGLYTITIILDPSANSVCVHFGGLAILVLECGNFSFAEVFLEFLQRLQFLATLLNPWISV